MDKKGYYKLLNVSENASEKEIKNSFRKLSLKYHPDKQVNKSEAEKKEAEDQFKKINQAYQVLSDPEKKKNYDTYGDEDLQGGGFNADPFGGFGGFGGNPFGGGFADMFNDVFGGFNRGRSRAQRPVENGADVRMKVPLTFSEVFNGCTKKLKFVKNVRCSTCHGNGGTGEKLCPQCNGSGRVYQHKTNGGMVITVEETCPHCKGKGKTYEHKCPSCENGFKKQDHVVEINFPAGMPNGYAVEKPFEAHESPDVRGKNGTFYAFCDYSFDTDMYNINGLDVIQKVYLPYYELLLGTEYILELPNNTKKKINIPSCIQNGKMLRLYREGIQGQGNSKGDYYLQVFYEMPTKLTENEKKNLENIKVQKVIDNEI